MKNIITTNNISKNFKKQKANNGTLVVENKENGQGAIVSLILEKEHQI
ncbi:MAG: hypothetical protein RSF88_08145 [Lachnospiraceae bacterium]